MSRIVPQRMEPTPRTPQSKATAASRAAWAAKMPCRCMVCGNPPSEVDHILAGSSRADVPTNWLLVCRECHDDKHNKGTLLPAFIACKSLCDPEHFSEAELQAIYQKRLPDWSHIATAMKAFRDYYPVF